MTTRPHSPVCLAGHVSVVVVVEVVVHNNALSSSRSSRVLEELSDLGALQGRLYVWGGQNTIVQHHAFTVYYVYYYYYACLC